MAPRLHEETDSHFVVNDGRGTFKVAKAGLSDSMQARIRQLGVQRKAEGGGVELPPGMDVSDLPSGPAAMPGYVPQTEPMPYAPPPRSEEHTSESSHT